MVKSLTYSVTNHRVKLSAHLAKLEPVCPSQARDSSTPGGSSRLSSASTRSARPSRRVIAWIHQAPDVIATTF